jgi:hypothetical protein
MFSKRAARSQQVINEAFPAIGMPYFQKSPEVTEPTVEWLSSAIVVHTFSGPEGIFLGKGVYLA